MIHLSKVAVGIESLEHLQEVQKGRRHQAPDGSECVKVYTRFQPKKAEDLMDGGSLYWIIKGHYVARQAVLGFDSFTADDGKPRCLILVTPKITATVPQPRRAHQGWRYLKPEDVPKDLSDSEAAAQLPPHMEAELRALGLL